MYTVDVYFVFFPMQTLPPVQIVIEQVRQEERKTGYSLLRFHLDHVISDLNQKQFESAIQTLEEFGYFDLAKQVEELSKQNGKYFESKKIH